MCPEAGTVKIYDPTGTGVEVPVSKERFAEAFERSKQLLAEHRHPVFEAGFKAAGALAFADVMLPQGRGAAWKMVEVKSSTSVKDYHRDDVAVQTFIARAAGVSIDAVALACINTGWTYPGGGDYSGLLRETDLTAEVIERADEAKSWIEEAQRVAARETAPDVAPGAQCCDPFECGFCAFCNLGRPQPEYPLSWLPRLSARTREKLAEAGIDDLRKAPDLLLNDAQRRVKKHSISGTVFFDQKGAAKALHALRFPAYFLDFETIQFAVPIWAGTRPYQQIPFQFSLHILDHAGKLTQRAFLDLSGEDPSEKFAHALIEACGSTGPVFVYNAGFESGRIRELAERFPALLAYCGLDTLAMVRLWEFFSGSPQKDSLLPQ